MLILDGIAPVMLIGMLRLRFLLSLSLLAMLAFACGSAQTQNAPWTFAVSRTTGMPAMEGICCISLKVVGPSISGIITSIRMASGLCSRATSMPSRPQAAV